MTRLRAIFRFDISSVVEFISTFSEDVTGGIDYIEYGIEMGAPAHFHSLEEYIEFSINFRCIIIQNSVKCVYTDEDST